MEGRSSERNGVDGTSCGEALVKDERGSSVSIAQNGLGVSTSSEEWRLTQSVGSSWYGETLLDANVGDLVSGSSLAEHACGSVDEGGRNSGRSISSNSSVG